MRLRTTLPAALLTGALALLSACGGQAAIAIDPPGADRIECGTLNLAVNPWIGYQANVAVLSYLAKTRLGCTVSEKEMTAEDAWKGLADGSVDAIVENWGHDDLKTRYIDNERVVVELGVTGNKGETGWYVPPWLARKYPAILDYANLNDFATMLSAGGTTGPDSSADPSGDPDDGESGGESDGESGESAATGGVSGGKKGRLLVGDQSAAGADKALITNLKLNYTVVPVGGEQALIEAFRAAEAGRDPLLGKFSSPQWFLAEMPLVKVNLPPYKPGCDADPAKVACDFRPYDLDKVGRKAFAESGSPAAELIKNFQWSNDEQNEVARMLAVEKLSRDDAAKKWLDANGDVWQDWLPQ